ncbi:MAG: HAMP domain-containing histidine kinase [Acidimicrobiia bacterium]|nr:HAMP domain-containing histidine kinase [Acidimicrobiia bacterium]MBT8250210.1 HAMP domain-containing histidine kinase [Acidimicrobiia bacterium]NNC43094.1 HAMP domain-containing histidine kinase [Acidimicrobiia bacterium]NND12960.1 HAMP domain-containing histidine kinase [Acidimicrobiia bacterium]NNL28373.1 HAMP domain-containing histidine kinase [Acidimicrobiia bacterium]
MSRHRQPPWARRWHENDEEWWRQGEEWWSGPGQGREAWRTFGRAMAVKALLFLGFLALILVGLGALIANIFSQVSLGTGILVVILTPVVLISTLGLIARAGARTWRPVRDLITAAGDLADGDYSARVAIHGSPATRQVVDSFNDMASRLETADQQRRRLLADLGHELRTPLTVIRGEIEAMIDGVHALDRENLEPLVGEVEMMERLLEDLRTLSLLEAGALPLHPEPTELATLVGDVADSYQRRAGTMGIEVVVQSTPVEIVLDPDRIREVVTNLMNNAFKAMPGGGRLTLRVEPKGGGARIQVSDTGTGIDPSDQDRIFERFQKGPASSGSGLGLTISRNLVQAHGGSISIASTPGVGTTFTIDLERVRPGTITTQ